jgi:hypothetical protein
MQVYQVRCSRCYVVWVARRMRQEVQRLVLLGSLPAESNSEVSKVEEFQRALEAIAPPVSNDEAESLMAVFGPDDCFGLAWTLLHLIESAPEIPLSTEPPNDANEWVRRLWDSAHR